MKYTVNDTLRYTRYYADNFEKEVMADGSERNLSYIYANGTLVGINIQTAGTDSTFFVFVDQLGSLRCITDTEGKVRQRLGFDAWGNRRNPITGEKDTTLLPSIGGAGGGFLVARGYTGHEHLDEMSLINMNGRVYDPVLGMFISPDNYIQAPDFTQNFNRYAYCLNNPLMYTDPTGEIVWYVPIIIGAASGALYGGLNAEAHYGNFFEGAWKGAVTGAFGSAISMIGGAGMPFMQNLLLGTAEGALTGGLDAALWGNDVGKGMLWGAAGGAVLTTLTSENFKNWIEGEGFYNNSNAFKHMMGRGVDKQAILDYFGFEGKYDPNNPLFNNSTGEAITSSKTGEIFYGDAVFDDNYDKLAFVADHESIHRQNVLSGKYKGMKKIDFEVAGKEEWSTYSKNYKRQGLYPKHNVNIIERINRYGLQGSIYEFVVTPTGSISTSFKKIWTHFIYKLPRRF